MRLNRTALLLLFLLVSAASAVLLLSRNSYSHQDRQFPLAGFSPHHFAGTDALGRDRMVRTAAALVLSLAGATAASAITTSAAACVGTLASFGPASVGWTAMLACDAFLALPWLFLLMMVRSALPLTTSPANSAAITFTVLAALGWPACARAVYKGALQLRNADWMLYARAGGFRKGQLLRSVLPHLLPLLLPQFLITVPAFVIAEANLGALGLGIGEPLPSWGGMLLELDNSAMLVQTRWVFFPIALLIVVLLILDRIVVEV